MRIILYDEFNIAWVLNSHPELLNLIELGIEIISYLLLDLKETILIIVNNDNNNDEYYN